MTKVTSRDQAVEILEKIEFSSDGFVKRNPEAADYEAALEYLKDLIGYVRPNRVSIMSKERRRFGHVYPAQETGMFATFGKTDDGKATIRLTGTYGGYRIIDITFKEGETAVYDSYNFDYLGEIVKITPKGVTIKPNHYSTTKRLDLATFANRNHNFDLDKIHKRRAEWMD